MENPIQFTIVKDVPLYSSGAFCAIIVENNGESPTTVMPQKNRKRSIKIAELPDKNKGEKMQQMHEDNNKMKAILTGLNLCESRPLKTQDTPPEAIIRKENNEVLKLAALGKWVLWIVSITGTNAQNVYSSHMCPK